MEDGAVGVAGGATEVAVAVGAALGVLVNTAVGVATAVSLGEWVGVGVAVSVAVLGGTVTGAPPQDARSGSKTVVGEGTMDPNTSGEVRTGTIREFRR